jgi:hypothetical protein
LSVSVRFSCAASKPRRGIFTRASRHQPDRPSGRTLGEVKSRLISLTVCHRIALMLLNSCSGNSRQSTGLMMRSRH